MRRAGSTTRQQIADRGCPDAGAGAGLLGPVGEVAGAVPAGAGDDEQPARLDAAAWLRDGGAAVRRDGLDPAAAAAGADRRTVEIDRPAGCQQPGADDRHRTGPALGRVCSCVQSLRGVRVLAVPVLSAGVFSAASRLCVRQCAVDRAGVRRGRGDHRRPVGLGAAELGRRLHERQRQSLQQHQRQPDADPQLDLAGQHCREPAGRCRVPGSRRTDPSAARRGPAVCRRTAWGRSNVSVPGGVVRPPGGMGPGNRPPIGQNGGVNRPANRPAQTPGNRPNVGQGNRPNVGQGAGGANRPNVGQGAGGANRPNVGQGAGGANRPNVGQGAGGANRPNIGQGAGGANRPNIGQGAGNRPQVNRPTAAQRPAQRPAGGGRNPPALSGMNDGRAASQFGNRGAQSRQASAPRARPAGGGGGRAGGRRRRPCRWRPWTRTMRRTGMTQAPRPWLIGALFAAGLAVSAQAPRETRRSLRSAARMTRWPPW